MMQVYPLLKKIFVIRATNSSFPYITKSDFIRFSLDLGFIDTVDDKQKIENIFEIAVKVGENEAVFVLLNCVSALAEMAFLHDESKFQHKADDTNGAIRNLMVYHLSPFLDQLLWQQNRDEQLWLP